MSFLVAWSPFKDCLPIAIRLLSSPCVGQSEDEPFESTWKGSLRNVFIWDPERVPVLTRFQFWSVFYSWGTMDSTNVETNQILGVFTFVVSSLN